jgi:hypothetical protein
VRAGPSLSAAEVGEIASGSIISVTGIVDDFYRLADGRGYVKRIVDNAISWERIERVDNFLYEMAQNNGESSRNNSDLEQLLMGSLEKDLETKLYTFLCELFERQTIVCNDNHDRIFSKLSLDDLGILFKLAEFGDEGNIWKVHSKYGGYSQECKRRRHVSGAEDGMDSSAFSDKSPIKSALPSPLKSALTNYLFNYVENRVFHEYVEVIDRIMQLVILEMERIKRAALIRAVIIHSKTKDSSSSESLRTRTIPLDELTLSAASNPVSVTDATESVEIESKHDYDNNSNLMWAVHIPGAKGLEIVFDERCSTENNYVNNVVLVYYMFDLRFM